MIPMTNMATTNICAIRSLVSSAVCATSIFIRISTRSSCGTATIPTIVATIVNFSIPLRNSINDLILINRVTPLMGEILSTFGVRESELKTSPLTTNFPATASAISKIIVGPMPIVSSSATSLKTLPILAASTLIAWKFCSKPPLIPRILYAKNGPKNPAINAPPIITAKCDTSCEVITWPFSRASSNLRGVASSVFCDRSLSSDKYFLSFN